MFLNATGQIHTEWVLPTRQQLTESRLRIAPLAVLLTARAQCFNDIATYRLLPQPPEPVRSVVLIRTTRGDEIQRLRHLQEVLAGGLVR